MSETSLKFYWSTYRHTLEEKYSSANFFFCSDWVREPLEEILVISRLDTNVPKAQNVWSDTTAPYDLCHNPGALSSITLASTKRKPIFKKVWLTSFADISLLLLRARQCIDSQEFSSETFIVSTIPDGLTGKNTQREFLGCG
jgi:hypothetical protein